MKKITRFFATRHFSLIDLVVGAGFVALLDADRVVLAFVVLMIGALVSLIAERVAK